MKKVLSVSISVLLMGLLSLSVVACSDRAMAPKDKAAPAADTATPAAPAPAPEQTPAPAAK
jgi:hypothetical protein